MNITLQNKIEKSYPLAFSEGNESRKVLYFNIGAGKDILPGHFYMLNYNGCQKPFSVSHYLADGHIGFTIEDRGSCSRAMINAKAGDYFGLTGPLGNPFKLENYKSFLLVGGGIGAAPINFLASYLDRNGKSFDLLLGERTSTNIIYENDLSKFNTSTSSTSIYTDDGSKGKKGFVTSELESILQEKTYDSVCLCGPEVMMMAVIDKVDGKIDNIQVCMERYMKCGLGLCGSCVIDDVGLRVCEEGPVFSYYEQLKNSKEFGFYHRNGNGIIKKF